MAWLRLYDSILDDPKIQMLSDRAFRVLINLWCLAKRNGGMITGDIKSLSFSLRMPEGKVRDTLQALISAKLIEEISEGYVPHDWNEHQYDSDNAAERMRAFRLRNKKRNQLRNSDVPDTDSEPDTEPESSSVPNGTAASGRTAKNLLNGRQGDFTEFYAAFPRHVGRGAAVKAYVRALTKATPAEILAGAKRYAIERADENPKYTKHPGPWLNEERWLDEGVGPPKKPERQSVGYVDIPWNGDENSE